MTSAALKATLQLTGETFADADITTALTSASRAIDELCGRRFFTTGSDETRYFAIPWTRAPLWTDRVKVVDLLSLTSLATDPTGGSSFPDTWTVNTDFTYEPVNAALDGKPYQWIVRHPLGRFQFPVGYPRSIRVVGKFGWSAAPAQVVDATTILASIFVRRKREAPFGVVTVGLDMGTAVRIARSDPHVSMLLQPFMEAPFA